MARKVLERQGNASIFQDGAPSKMNGELLLHSLSMITGGKSRSGIHKENAMNDLRQSVGLYVHYPLANDLLAGASRRYV